MYCWMVVLLYYELLNGCVTILYTVEWLYYYIMYCWMVVLLYYVPLNGCIAILCTVEWLYYYIMNCWMVVLLYYILLNGCVTILCTVEWLYYYIMYCWMVVLLYYILQIEAFMLSAVVSVIKMHQEMINCSCNFQWPYSLQWGYTHDIKSRVAVEKAVFTKKNASFIRKLDLN